MFGKQGFDSCCCWFETLIAAKLVGEFEDATGATIEGELTTTEEEEVLIVDDVVDDDDDLSVLVVDVLLKVVALSANKLRLGDIDAANMRNIMGFML